MESKLETIMKKEHLKLSSTDLEKVQELLSKGTLKARKYNRAKGILELHRGKTYAEVSRLLSVAYPTVLDWARRYKSEGLAFLEDKPRSGRPIGISGEERAKVTALACTDPPDGYSSWSLRLLADKVVELDYFDKISHTQIGTILKKTNLNLTSKNNGVSEP